MSVFREFFVKTTTRSSGWGKIRKNHVKKHCSCAVCGKTKKLEVHHIKDFSEHKELELDPNNLITLCSRCHLLFGHLGYWRSINPTIVEDSKWFIEKIRNRR